MGGGDAIFKSRAALYYSGQIPNVTRRTEKQQVSLQEESYAMH